MIAVRHTACLFVAAEVLEAGADTPRHRATASPSTWLTCTLTRLVACKNCIWKLWLCLWDYRI